MRHGDLLSWALVAPMNLSVTGTNRTNRVAAVRGDVRSRSIDQSREYHPWGVVAIQLPVKTLLARDVEALV
jgi:hypothetical protein